MPNKKAEKKLKVIYEYSPSPDAEERVQRAFAMLFEKMDSYKNHEPDKESKK